ncbi:EAL domain-containing protein [Rugamonas sp. CCM 8940]|uniref:sensor domain-containing protein n=1 Tax=Rugamonas sp. CCM 8940 TaxID=2765359 RepID=UPI00351C1A13
MDDQKSIAAASAQGEPGRPAEQALDLIARVVAAIELTPLVAVHSVDRAGRVRFWNHTCAQLYGVAAEQALGQPLLQLLRPQQRAAEHAAALEQVWQSGRPSPARDWQVRSAAGRQLWVYSSMFPVYRGGELQQIFSMDIDVTARRREEGALLSVGANFRQMFDKSSDAILVIERDRIAELNPAALALFDCADAGRMLGKSLADFSPLRQDGGALSAQAGLAMAQQAHRLGNWRYDWRYTSCGGRPFWAEVLLTSITLDHEFLFYAVVRDISARKQAEQRLYLAAQVFENSRDAILLADRLPSVIAVNQAYSATTGRGPAEMVGQALDGERVGIEDAELFRQIWGEMSELGHWQGEIWAQRRGGERYPAWLSLAAIADQQGAVANYMLILSDISERKRSEETTRHLAEHDFLTDLPNRVLLLDRLSLSLTAARRNHSMLAILFLDLDRFKHINDTLGHHVGDLLLKEVAARLVKCVRAVDTVSRQGGDEFVIILADIGGIDQAAHVAASVLQSITQTYELEQHRLDVTTSIGISIFPDDGADIETLVKNADLAMYHAKEGGRNRFQFFNAEMNAQIVERVAFENGLRCALREGQFELEFQPEIDVASGATVGAEALIRWRHPQLGRLLPERFIGVAEDCGLMVAIGNWVLREACRQARRWQEEGRPLVVAVNISLAQLVQNNLPHSVAEALQVSGLAPGLLELELTEAIIMRQGGAASAKLQALRALGVGLTIDDFGTGYSRLGHLRDYPVDKLKIDRSFMADLASEPGDAAVATAIIGVARSLKLIVVAEGVETAAQLQFLRHHGCDRYQGRYIAPAALESAPQSASLDGAAPMNGAASLDGAAPPPQPPPRADGAEGPAA